MKSRQTITVDYAAATVTQTPVEIGKTDFGLGELEGIRSKFVISGQSVAGGEAHFDVKGQTASAAMVIPNIDYKFTFDLDQNNGTYKVKGCHDGFPSYTIKVGTYLAYDYEQSWNPLALLGSCDTSVDVSGP